MLRFLEIALIADLAFLILFYVAALASTWTFFQKGVEEGPVIPMTVIKPMRGSDVGLEENLEALIGADHGGNLQILFVMEESGDPAYATAAKVAGLHPGRDIRLILSGPSGQRMGKVHNMIEGLKEAKHPFVVFSDSDVIADRAILIETSRAFVAGAGAVCAPPDATGNIHGSDALLGLSFNHFFSGPASLIYRLGLPCPFAGGWMAFRRDLLEGLGGLERFSQCSADDFSLGLAAFRSGAKVALLPRMVRIREAGGSLSDVTQHLLKWMTIIRYNLPALYLFAPLGNPVFIASVLLALAAAAGSPIPTGIALLMAVAFLRIIVAVIQDCRSAVAFFPIWAYLILPAADLAFVMVWFVALFSKTLLWRGKKYRLHFGGRAESLG